MVEESMQVVDQYPGWRWDGAPWVAEETGGWPGAGGQQQDQAASTGYPTLQEEYVGRDRRMARCRWSTTRSSCLNWISHPSRRVCRQSTRRGGQQQDQAALTGYPTLQEEYVGS